MEYQELKKEYETKARINLADTNLRLSEKEKLIYIEASMMAMMISDIINLKKIINQKQKP